MKIEKLGRYEIIDELGHGAMGIVYRATDPIINRVVAIKTINMALGEDAVGEYEARFYQEARAAGSLNHPNIVTVYDIGKSGTVVFMAMEFLSGRELRALLARGEPLPVAQAVEIAAQVADGLAYAHQHSVVHRDIKPANIMIVHAGLAKITDFGIARMRSSKTVTHSGAIVGSPRYMSPEQVLGRRTGPQSDVFSLGAVLYEMITGRAAFFGSDVNAVMFQILNLVPPVPSAVNPAVPELLNLVVAKAMAKASDERYASAAELAADLRGCRGKMGVAPVIATQAKASVSAQPKIDQESSASLHSDSLPGTRRGDAEHAVNDPSPTLGVAMAFDSLEATLRLAAQTGMTQEIEAYAKTQKMRRAHEPAPDPLSAMVAPYRLASTLERDAWGRRDQLIFATGIGAALLLALGLVLL